MTRDILDGLFLLRIEVAYEISQHSSGGTERSHSQFKVDFDLNYF